MNDAPAAPAALTGHLVLLSLISFGGIPTVFPDLHHFVIAEHGWITDRDFADFFAVIQAVPGPNMILMMSFIGWKVGGLGGAIASALATFGPSCTVCFVSFRLWDCFRHAGWQRIARRGLAPVTIGLVIAGGVVMAGAADTSWRAIALTAGAVLILLTSRISPLWTLAAGGALGALGVL
jgi:chromate transporter